MLTIASSTYMVDLAVTNALRQFRDWSQRAIQNVLITQGNEPIKLMGKGTAITAAVSHLMRKEQPTKSWVCERTMVFIDRSEEKPYVDVSVVFRYGPAKSDAQVPITLRLPLDKAE